MRTLTQQESDLVEQNHDLIYWYANLKHLQLDEWYDFLALQLCYAVMHFNPERGKLSTYFKMRCDTACYREYRNKHENHLEYNDEINLDTRDNVLSSIIANEVLSVAQSEILDLTLQGYTQKEIASKLEISQSWVNAKLKEIKIICKEYFEVD